MDQRDLLLFVHLSDSLHFGKSGEALHMSASAVSRAVQRMEQELDCRLLERDKRSVALTEQGRQFQQYARQAVQEWRAFRDGLRDEQRSLSGEVSVYCSVTASYSVLATILAAFRPRHPDIDIKLHTGVEADALKRVATAEGEDVVIAARTERLASKLQFHTLQHTPLLFIRPRIACAVNTMLQQWQGPDDHHLWADMPFILPERGLARQRFDQWCRQQGFQAKIYAQVGGHEAIVSMVSLGLGLGIVPELVLQSSPLAEQVASVAMDSPLAPYAVGICSQSRRLQNPLIRAFWDAAVSAYRFDK